MSLVGNLEDLGLGDILQIVSLSRKSGELALHSRGREGRIVFRNGQVTRALSSVFRENLGDLLLRKGLVEVETLKQALALQKASHPPQRLGTILAQRFGISGAAIEEAVKEQVEKIVYSFFGWTDGTFAFELGESDDPGGTGFNPLQFMLDQGLNPQWLAMEGSRLLDEKRHRGESLEAAGEEPLLDTERLLAEVGTASAPVPKTAAAPAPAPPAGEGFVLLIDDDLQTREEMVRALRERGLTAEAFARAEEFLAAAEVAAQNGLRPVLLIDLIMPRADGRGLLGGLELLERVRERFPGLPALMMSDHANEEAERRVRGLGAPAVLAKPKRGEILQVRNRQLLEDLGAAVAALAGEPAATDKAPPPPGYNWGAELLREIGETAPPPGKGPESPGLHLLKGMLQELQNPALGGGIILLVLRFASELMNRAVIFLVKEAEIAGLGQFGIGSGSEAADVRVRRMRIPRDGESVFGAVLQAMVPMTVRLGTGRWDAYLREQLGGGEPEEVFLGPIVSEGKVVAVIYGDNLPEKKSIGDTEALEIFLSQAGLAMEKALLERRLRGKDVI